MTTACLRVISLGPQISLQDGGRPGAMRFGVPASGPMDRTAFAIANAALANPPGTTAIEVSRGGLVLECTAGPITLAVAGGGFIVQHNGARHGSWVVLTLRAGERLSIRPGPWGSWTYIAFAGMLDAAIWLGSSATHALSGLGGGMLAAGQDLHLSACRSLPATSRRIACPVWARPNHWLPVTLGPQDRYFPPTAVAALQGQPFALTDAYDRMGVRLRGPDLRADAALNLPSEPILRGAVQVAGDGVATVLLADHQTTGGYPKIATALNGDLDAFCQLRPHDSVRFALFTPAAAIARTRHQARIKARHLAALTAAAHGGNPPQHL